MLIFSLDAEWTYSKMVSGSLIRNNIYFKNKTSIKIKLISVDTEKKKEEITEERYSGDCSLQVAALTSTNNLKGIFSSSLPMTCCQR